MMTPLEIPAMQYYLRDDITSFVDMDTLYQNMEQTFAKALNQQYLAPENREGGDFAATVWLYAAMVDAAVSDKDYPAAKYECEAEWENAVKWLKKELGKKKFLTGKLIYNVPKLCMDAAASLRCMDSDSCGGQLIAWVRESGGSLTDLFESSQILGDRLHKTADKLS